MKTERCRSCGAEIIYAVGKSGKTNPIDAEPVPPDAKTPGNVRLVPAEDGGQPLALYDTKNSTPALDDDGVRYLSHFATCPEAGKWRRG